MDSIDLSAIAHQAMIDAGFVPDVPHSVLDELQSLASKPPAAVADPSTRDLRPLLWSSIDDRKSRDLDQVEYAERLPNGDICVRVGIANVDALVQKGSAIDSHAAENGTSVYTGVRTFPMLPEQLSTEMTSLVGGEDRSSIVTEVIIAPDGMVKSTDVYPALLHNFAKLSYESVGAGLDNTGPMPAGLPSVTKIDVQIGRD